MNIMGKKERSKRYYEKYKERLAQRAKNKRAENKLAGVCSNHPDTPTILGKTICKKCSERIRVRRKKLLIQKMCPGHPTASAVPGKKACFECLEYHKKSGPARRLIIKAAAMAHYGGERCACPNCPQPTPGLKFLTIDHINNDGATHRKTFKGPMHRWLKTNNYPSGFQVLCFNCNCGKNVNNGVCPHLESINAETK